MSFKAITAMSLWIFLALPSVVHGQIIQPPISPSEPATKSDSSAPPKDTPPLLPLAHPTPPKSRVPFNRTSSDLSERVNKIKDELEHPPADAPAWAAEWAGRYRGRELGWGSGETFWLAPTSGVLFTAYNCEGLVDWRESEIVETFEGGIKIRTVAGQNISPQHVLTSTLHFVKWGDRRYLVPQYLMQDFVDKFNEGGRARRVLGGIPLKQNAMQGDDRYYRPCPAGKPELPEPWFSKLLDESIKYKVLAVREPVKQDIKGEPRRWWAYLDLDKGFKDGVANGMRLEYRVGDCTAEVGIQAVTENTCVGVFSSKGTLTESLEPPKVGTTIENQEIDDLNPLNFKSNTP